MATTGEIARLISEKGFGFIRAADGSDVFFHRSCMCSNGRQFEELGIGDPVELEIAEAPKGLRANWVLATR